MSQFDPTSELGNKEVGEYIDRVLASIGFILGLYLFVLAFGAFGVASKMDDSLSGLLGQNANKDAIQRIGLLEFFMACGLWAFSYPLFNSKAWAHWALMAIAALEAIGCASEAPAAAVWSLLFVNYCLLRLTGTLGTRPQGIPPSIEQTDSQPQKDLVEPYTPIIKPLELPPFSGTPGKVEVWISKIDFKRFHPKDFMDICRACGQGDWSLLSEDEFFTQVRYKWNWPYKLYSGLGREDADNLQTSLAAAGVEVVLQEGE